MAVTAKTLYCFLGRSSLQSDRSLYHTTDHRSRDDSRGVGRVLRSRGTAGCRRSTGLILESATDLSPNRKRLKMSNISSSVCRASSPANAFRVGSSNSLLTLTHAHLSHF